MVFAQSPVSLHDCECGASQLSPGHSHKGFNASNSRGILIGMVGDTQFSFSNVQAFPYSVHFSGVMQDRLVCN